MTTLLTVVFCRGRGWPASSTSCSQLVTRWSSYLVRFSESLLEFLAWQSTSFSPGPCLLFTRWFSVAAAAADVSSKTTNFYRRQATLTLVRAPSASVRPPPSSLLAPSMSLSLSLSSSKGWSAPPSSTGCFRACFGCSLSSLPLQVVMALPEPGWEERAISVKFLNVALLPFPTHGALKATPAEWCGVLPGNKFQ